ncbi:MAG: HAMP domain-containing protein, partial [Chloroflexi bacterium]|nr:HAMP domain-containing protein [Chloroflexota bacterium]
MLRSRFFWKLYFAFAGLALITTAGTGFLVHQQLQASLNSDLELELLDLAQALSPFAEDVFVKGPLAEAGDGRGPGYRWPRDVQERVVEIGRETETRITLIATDGEVVADSQGDPATLDNHASRPEIAAASGSPYGASRRFSQTVQDDLLYVALALRDGDRMLGTVRTAIPLTEIDVMLSGLRATIGWGALLGVLLAMGVGVMVARRITSPVTEMTMVAEALQAGAYDQRVESLRSDEFGLLGATLNRLADELTKRISTLARERAQLGAMVAGLQEGVIAVDDRDHLILSNEAANRFLGLRPGAGKSDMSLTELAETPGIRDLIAAAQDTDSAIQDELVVRRDGAEFVLDARATPFAANGKRGTVVVLYDITDLRRLERLRTDFVANVSHELKTPLTAIAGFVETLSGGAIHDEEYNLRFLGKIEQQVARLDALVTDLLSLARIEAVDEAPSPRPVGWMAVVHTVVERYRDSGALEGLSLSVAAGDEEIRALGDTEAMEQVLDNLLGNAIKYTPSG